MVEIDKKMIRYLTKLSRIECTEEEQDRLLKDLTSILKYFEQLSEVDTDNVLPCDHVLENMVNVMREDETGTPMPRETFLANAPSHTGGMIRIPPVFKNS